MSDLTIRSAVQEDLEQVLLLGEAAGSPPSVTETPRRACERCSPSSPMHCLVAEDSGPLVGSLIAVWDGRRASFYRLEVDPGRRREGIATVLQHEGERRLQACGAIRLTAIVAGSDAAATGFWQAAGYTRQPDQARSGTGLMTPPPFTTASPRLLQAVPFHSSANATSTLALLMQWRTDRERDRVPLADTHNTYLSVYLAHLSTTWCVSMREILVFCVAHFFPFGRRAEMTYEPSLSRIVKVPFALVFAATTVRPSGAAPLPESSICQPFAGRVPTYTFPFRIPGVGAGWLCEPLPLAICATVSGARDVLATAPSGWPAP